MSKDQPLSPLYRAAIAPSRLVASYGDSRALGAAAYSSRTANLLTIWIEALSKGAIRIPGNLGLGHSGYTTAQLAANATLLPAVATAKAAGAGAVILIMSRNDRPAALTAAQSIANMAIIEAAWLAAGIQVIWLAEYPQGDTTWTGTDNPPTSPAFGATNLGTHMAVRRWIISRRRRGVFVVDTFNAIADRSSYTSSAAGYALPGYLGDGIHPSIRGAYYLAKSILPVVQQIWPACNLLIPANAADSYNATTADGSIVGNPTMNGAAGTINGGTGSVATSWVTGSSLPSGLTAAYSKVTVEGREWQQVAYSGTAPSGTPVHNAIQRDTTYGTNGVAVGKTYQLVCEYEIDASQTGIYKINPFMNDGVTTWSAADSSSGFAYGEYPTEAYRGIFLTDPFTINGSGSLRTAVGIGFTASASVALTLRIGTMATLPVTLPGL